MSWILHHAEVRLGRWQDVLADVSAGTVICDPPYGQRTHSGALQGGEMADGRTLNLTDTSRGGDPGLFDAIGGTP